MISKYDKIFHFHSLTKFNIQITKVHQSNVHCLEYIKESLLSEFDFIRTVQPCKFDL